MKTKCTLVQRFVAILLLFVSFLLSANIIFAGNTVPLNFTAVNGSAEVRLMKDGNPAAISLQYSTDNCATWSDYTLNQNINLTSGRRVYFKAKSRNNSFSTDNNNSYRFLISGQVEADGNIMSLLDASMTQNNVPESAFCYLFKEYYGGSLIKAPILPATILAKNCYEGMFYGCTSLKEAPALPATVIAEACYYQMFYGCTSLEEAPALPATTLAEWCYSRMFERCSSLTVLPTLPATRLARLCYACMFMNCSSVIDVPILPATTMEELCYSRMFEGCTYLAELPVLHANTLAKECYSRMFYSCKSLVVNTEGPGNEWHIPDNATPAGDWNKEMFLNTGGTFKGSPQIGVTYYVSSQVPSALVDVRENNCIEMLSNPVHPSESAYLHIMLDNEDFSNMIINVLTINGLLISTFIPESDIVEINGLDAAGIYVVRVTTADGRIYSEKLVVE